MKHCLRFRVVVGLVSIIASTSVIVNFTLSRSRLRNALADVDLDKNVWLRHCFREGLRFEY